HSLARLTLEIDRHGPLAGVLSQKRRAHQLAVKVRVGAELAGQIAGMRRLDLDHLGAKQRELIGTERPGQYVGQVEDANSLKQPPSHVSSCLLSHCDMDAATAIMLILLVVEVMATIMHVVECRAFRGALPAAMLTGQGP